MTLNWNNWKNTRNWLLQIKFNVLIYGIVFFYLSRLEKRGSSY